MAPSHHDSRLDDFIPPTPSAAKWAMSALPAMFLRNPTPDLAKLETKLETPPRHSILSPMVNLHSSSKNPGILKTPGTASKPKSVKWVKGYNDTLSITENTNPNDKFVATSTPQPNESLLHKFEKIHKSVEIDEDGSFQLVDPNNNKKRGSKSGLPNNYPGKFPSPWTPRTKEFDLLLSSLSTNEDKTNETKKNTSSNIKSSIPTPNQSDNSNQSDNPKQIHNHSPIHIPNPHNSKNEYNNVLNTIYDHNQLLETILSKQLKINNESKKNIFSKNDLKKILNEHIEFAKLKDLESVNLSTELNWEIRQNTKLMKEYQRVYKRYKLLKERLNSDSKTSNSNDNSNYEKSLKNKIDLCQSTIMSQAQHIDDLESNKVIISSNLKQFKQELDNMYNINGILSQENESLKQKISTLTTTTTITTDSINITDDELVKTQDEEIKNLKLNLQLKNDQLIKIQKQLNENSKNYDLKIYKNEIKISQLNNELLKQNEKLKKQQELIKFSNSSNQENKLKNELTNILNKNNDLKQVNNNLQLTINRLEDKNMDLNLEVLQLKKNLDSKVRDLKLYKNTSIIIHSDDNNDNDNDNDNDNEKDIYSTTPKYNPPPNLIKFYKNDFPKLNFDYLNHNKNLQDSNYHPSVGYGENRPNINYPSTNYNQNKSINYPSIGQRPNNNDNININVGGGGTPYKQEKSLIDTTMVDAW